MAKITYSDKVQLNTNSSIPSVNKCEATDLNEIKNSVNENIDLSNKYITATAGSNGDFYIDIDTTLYTNMIVNVSFPSATTNTSNARLSIDGGTNYKDIKWDTSSNINILSKFVENSIVNLYYDGAYFRATNVDTGWQTPIYDSTVSTSTAQVRRIGNNVYWTGQINVNSGYIVSLSVAITLDDWATASGDGVIACEMGGGTIYTKIFYRNNNTIQIAANPTGNTTYIVTTAIYIGK